MKKLLNAFYTNHVLSTSLVFIFLALGIWSFIALPKDKAPAVDFHWVVIQSIYPGANPQDIETRVTNPIENALLNTQDIKFSLSTSRENVSDLLIRFDDISEKTYAKHLSDMKAKLSSLSQSLPNEVKTNLIEINSANTFPSATLVLTTDDVNDEFIIMADQILTELQGFPEIYQANALGAPKKVSDILLKDVKLNEYQLNPLTIEQYLKPRLKATLVGDYHTAKHRRPLNLDKHTLFKNISKVHIPTMRGPIELADIASIEPKIIFDNLKAGNNGKSGILISIMKTPDANLLELITKIKGLVEDHKSKNTNTQLILVNDQSHSTHEALQVMYNNAFIGLALVLLVVGLFLGLKQALIIAIAMPVIFSLSLLTLKITGQSLNITVLLALVVVLGMVVDDSIVILEAISAQLQKGKKALESIWEGLSEIFFPVTTTVLTTLATFLPLMLLPGILGKFMFVLPLVVSITLIFSLVEGMLLMPAHIHHSHNLYSPKQAYHTKISLFLRTQYLKSLIYVLRKPWIILSIIIILLSAITVCFVKGTLKVNFFSIEPQNVFYVDVTLPLDTPNDKVWLETEKVASQIDKLARNDFDSHTAYYTGIQFTQVGVDYGSHLGQIMVSLNHKQKSEIHRFISNLKSSIKTEESRINYRLVSDGPPLTDTLDLKLLGNDYTNLHQARLELIKRLKTSSLTLSDTSSQKMTYTSVRMDDKKIIQQGLNPLVVNYMLQLAVKPIAIHQSYQDGMKTEFRLGLEHPSHTPLNFSLLNPKGESVPIDDLISLESVDDFSELKHFNQHQMVELSFDYDQNSINALEGKQQIENAWHLIRGDFPYVQLKFHGLLDDILETLKLIPWVIALSIGLVYLILGAQFRSFTKPLIVFITTPLAIIGVLVGLVLSGYPLSIYALYGTIALIGIAVNAAILILACTGQKRAQGFSHTKAIIYASKRRFMPIVISATTTIAGLLSLCFGWGGESLLWGPVAAAIVYGLGISTILTLYCIPLVYLMLFKKKSKLSLNEGSL